MATNYNPSANVNVGCIIAVEGCTDPTKVNYNSKANVNSGTWCVPRKVGCMMPNENNANANFANLGGNNGLNSAFDPSVTVHDKKQCFPARYGCKKAGFINSDPSVTVETRCYKSGVLGCLNPKAKNYGCVAMGDSKCTDPDTMATRHNFRVCKYEGAADGRIKAPAPPAPETGSWVEKEVLEVTSSLQVGGCAGAVESAKSDVASAFGGAFPDMAPDSTTVENDPTSSCASRRRLAASQGHGRELSEGDDEYAFFNLVK